MILSKLVKAISQPYVIFNLLNTKGFLKLIPDKWIISIKYKRYLGESLNIHPPKTFNEKLQWLKLNDHREEYTRMVDKFEVRKYIEDKIGSKYLIPLIDVWDDFNDINFGLLPKQFVLKCTHDSGGLVICKDKEDLDIDNIKRKIEKSLKRNYFYHGREWPYKNVKPRIICETYMEDESEKELKDYKVFCFNGEPKLVQVDYNRFIDHKRNLYDTQWNFLNVSFQYPNDPNVSILKPEKFDEMLGLARKLSKELPFVRIDFYSIKNKLYFGEITFYPEAGFGKFIPESSNELLGSWIDLPNFAEKTKDSVC